MNTKLFNHIYYLICSLAVLISTIPQEFLDVLPPKYKHIVGIVAALLMWIKSHWNLFVNPDGTPAAASYQPGKDG